MDDGRVHYLTRVRPGGVETSDGHGVAMDKPILGVEVERDEVLLLRLAQIPNERIGLGRAPDPRLLGRRCENSPPEFEDRGHSAGVREPYAGIPDPLSDRQPVKAVASI